ncbi:MAG: hypothetical protein HS108_06160 [Planctomycetes bacterium]|jgi:hypothetical protein|nr:hypothetical protein [Planctomycetota bacterium]MCL4730600.1 hypothetical protein [Planctomycetota bacterium]
MALLEAIPYVAFAGAGLLVAFVGGEFALKKWKARGVKKAAPAIPEESGRGLVSKPVPLSTKLPAAVPSQRVPAAAESERAPVASERAVVVDTPVAQDSGSNAPVEVFDESESVRISEVAMLDVSGNGSARIPELSPESGRRMVVNLAAQTPDEPEQAPGFVPGADTERCPAVGTAQVLAAARASQEDADAAEVVCTDVIAARRDPSVRVFDAVVAPSERKTSAA